MHAQAPTALQIPEPSLAVSHWRCRRPSPILQCRRVPQSSARRRHRQCCSQSSNGSESTLKLTTNSSCYEAQTSRAALSSAIRLLPCSIADAAITKQQHDKSHPPQQQQPQQGQERQQQHKQQQQQQRAVLLEGPANVSGALPDVLQSTFSEHFPTPTSARKACRMRRVLVDGVLGKCDTQVAAGQLLQRLDAPPPRLREGGLVLQVVYEDEHMAIVVKPFGVPMHGRGTRTVKHNLAGNLQPSTAESAMPRPHPAHRLDTATGGLLICSKTRIAAAALTAAFESRRIHKRYRTILAGRLTPTEGSIDAPVGGRVASSSYRVLEHTRSLKFGGWITTVDLYPATGRKHQLRLHCAGLGHPILGDTKYTPEGADRLAGQGMCLWATELRLAHPVTGQAMELQLPEPARFQRVRANEGARWARFRGAQAGADGLLDAAVGASAQDLGASGGAASQHEDVLQGAVAV